ncbi:hypothetical protein [Aeromicrobium sp.]|uniref:hypothetical protein n=1 Tax=Aeromicrobium sp. TaxID=1871063 RepID=UPI0028A80D8F|nr:hypothetical protein [Aeromicrobium sp.]
MLAVALTGCGAEKSPAICSDVDTLKVSVDALTDRDFDIDSLTTLRDDLSEVRTNVKAVSGEAQNEYATEFDAVAQAASSVATSVETAVAAPSAAGVADVGQAIQALGAAVEALDDTVRGTC